MRISFVYIAAAVFLASSLPLLAVPPTTHQPRIIHNAQVRQIDQRVRTQWHLIYQGVKSGKLTKDQAATLRTSLKSIRLQEISFFKQNKRHSLTTDQQNQLTTMLDKNSQPIGETPTAK